MAQFLELQLLAHWEPTSSKGYIYALAGKEAFYIGQSRRANQAGGVTERYLEHLVEIFRRRLVEGRNTKVNVFSKENPRDVGAWIVQTFASKRFVFELNVAEAMLILRLKPNANQRYDMLMKRSLDCLWTKESQERRGKSPTEKERVSR